MDLPYLIINRTYIVYYMVPKQFARVPGQELDHIVMIRTGYIDFKPISHFINTCKVL